MFKKSLVLSFLFVMSLFYTNCIFAQRHIKGEGNLITQKREVGAFSKISLEAFGNVTFIQGTTPGITVETYQNVADLIETVVEGNTLRVRQKKDSFNHYYDFDNVKLNVVITNPTCDEINLSGSLNFATNGKITSPDLKINLSGSGNMNFDGINCTKTTIYLSGSGEISSKGSSDVVDIVLSGSGNVVFNDLQTRSTKIKISGSGNVECNATESYDFKISGSGSIGYKKSTASVNSKVSGSGNIESKN